MRLLLISINQQFRNDLADISVLGVRYLSAYLKEAGHQVSILFLGEPPGGKESETELAQIIELIGKLRPDLIGLSLVSGLFFRAVAITQAIKKKSGLPSVIWGGIHPTAEPRECLGFADLVCVGEGELAMEKLMSNLDRFKDLKIEGIWYKNGNEIIEGGGGMIVPDINSLPYPDYDLNNQYILHQEKISPLSVKILKQYSPASVGAHRLMSSRGCPHNCAYCCNSVFRKLYGGSHLRWRSVDNFIEEMVEVKNKFPFIKRFKIADDNFTANNTEWIKEFNKQYKQKINLPFYCNVSSLTVNEEKLDLLVEAGLNHVQIGLQSGSDRVNYQIYSRPIRADNFLKAIKLLEKYRGRLTFIVDVIVDNPYEHEKDMIKTIKVLNQIKKPFLINMFSLVFYPGTSLYQRAITDKILIDDKEHLRKRYNSIENNLLNKIIYFAPRLTKQKIDQLTNNRHGFFTRFYIKVLYFAFTKKNKLPSAVLKLASRVLKRFALTAK